MKGGKREGSGRKRSENKKIRVSFSLAPDVVKYIRQRTDKPQAQIIEDAIRLLKIELNHGEYGSIISRPEVRLLSTAPNNQ